MIRPPNLLYSALIAGSFRLTERLLQGSGLAWTRSRFALLRRTGKREEALGLKRLLHLLTVASAAAVIALAATNAVRAADKQTLDPDPDSAGRGPILLVQIAAFRGAKGSETANVNVDSKGVILYGYDAVAFFKQRKPVKGNPGIESTYQGATYLFASTADKADFDKDPAKYAPQYGGFCAYGVLNGILSDIHANPDAFAVYKGKLYMCGDQGALRGFRSNIDSNIEKADTNWRQLTGS
jgi:YHS domain-containing protein